MRYLPHTEEEISAMLKVIGAGSIDDLFNGIPDAVKFKGELPLADGLNEIELKAHLKSLADKNISLAEGINFIGGGSYHHYAPSVINALVKRGEFLTAYTPYQPEVSQGTLQAMFEFQTMMCELTGMEVANASNYDLSTACAEAVMMARRVNQKKRVLVAKSLHPHYREVMTTYFKDQDYELVEIPWTSSGQIDMSELKSKLDDSISAVLVQSPNFFGTIEDTKTIGALVKDKPALFVVATSEALSYAVTTSPGEAGADIAIGEGMSFGLGTNYGGPYVGIFATKQQFIRSMPGRLIGQTTDADGKRGYVLTFATREQHIRREKATSNICTNQGLCALIASVYLSLMGPQGLTKLALMNMERLKFLKDLLTNKKKDAVLFTGPSFNEMVIKLNKPVRDAVGHLLKDRIFAGIDLSSHYPELDRHLLVCTTELVSHDDIKVFADRIGSFL